MKEKSSLELFAIALYEGGFLQGNGDEINALLEQHKAMHKEEIKDAYNQGYRDGEHDASNIPLSIGDISEYNNAEQYYNETFGGNNGNNNSN